VIKLQPSASAPISSFLLKIMSLGIVCSMLLGCSTQTKVNCPGSYDQVFGIKGIKDPNKKQKYKRVRLDKNGLAKKKQGYYK
jgi:hypothetical protein